MWRFSFGRQIWKSAHQDGLPDFTEDNRAPCSKGQVAALKPKGSRDVPVIRMLWPAGIWQWLTDHNDSRNEIHGQCNLSTRKMSKSGGQKLT